MTVEEIFLEAVEKGRSDRAKFLDQACGAAGEIRAQVEALLKSHEDSGGILEQPLYRPAQTVDAPPPSEQAGMIIGPYKLIEQIGEGGMGAVWMAQQTEPVRRLVAIKLIKAGMDSKQVVARFEAERQALALMDHPNIARVLEAGTTSAGRPYFVMDLVKGGVPITRYCDEHRLTPRQRLELFNPVCHAIQHAHQKGVIHRDLKPTNVLIARYDGVPTPKVIDFGVAKATGQALTDKTLITGFGAVVGTLEYMSPEQAEVNQIDVDTRSDIYSLGVLLYELLTGGPPFSRKQLESAGMLEMLRVIREKEPSKPSTKLSSSHALPTLSADRGMEPMKLAKLLRGELDWIVMKALEKDRSRRYQTANGLAMDVQRYLAGETVQACPPSPVYRLRKFASRNRVMVLAGGLVTFSLIAGIIGTTWGLVEARSALRAEADQRARAEKSAAEARALNNFLTEDLLGQADPEQNAPDKKVTVEELLRRAEQRIDGNQRFADKPVLASTLHTTIARTYFRLGLLPEAERHFRQALAIRRDKIGHDAVETLAAQEALADFLNLGLAKPGESEPLAKQTWEARARVLGADDPDTLDSLDTYATAVAIAGRTNEAVELGRRCVEGRIKSLGPEHEQTLTSMNNLANALGQLADRHESISLLRDVVSIRRKGQGRAHDFAVSAHNLANGLIDVGEFEEADELVAEAERAVRSLGPEAPAPDRLAGLAVRIAVDRGRLDVAIKRGLQVLELRRKALPVGDFRTGMVLLELGRARALKGDFEAARRDLDEAYDILRKTPERSNSYRALWAQCWRGVTLTGLGRFSDAEPLLLEAHVGLQSTVEAPSLMKWAVIEKIIALYDKWGRPAAAAEWRKKLPVDDRQAKR